MMIPIGSRTAHRVRRPGVALILGTIALLGGTRPARGTFTGDNGRIVYQMELDRGTSIVRHALFLTGTGQLTFPPPSVDHFSPSWSPDGEQIAFTQYNKTLGDFVIAIINKDGTGLRQLVSSDAIDEEALIDAPAWSNDGQRIAFVVRNRTVQNGIWTIRTDGTGLTQVVQEYHGDSSTIANWPSWSPVRNEIVYMCWFRTKLNSFLRRDLCIVDADTRSRRTLPVAAPAGPALNEVHEHGRPSWSPDGEKILFTMIYGDAQGVTHLELFTVQRNGTGITQITNASSLVCPVNANDRFADRYFYSSTFSPDGASIVARSHKHVTTPLENGVQCAFVTEGGLWTLSANGGPASLLVTDGPTPFPLAYALVDDPDWQPLLGNLIVDLEDGHDNPLKGLKVEVRRLDGTVVAEHPANTIGGTYIFETPVAPGEYVLRATLIDDPGSPDSPPAFEIRHGGTATEPAWMEQRFTHADGTQVTIEFEDSPDLVDSNVPLPAHLDDMANIYFRVRQFVDWVKTRLTPDTGSTTAFYTFATIDPLTGRVVGPDEAYYRHSISAVVYGTAQSEYENRDGVLDPVEIDPTTGLDKVQHDDDAPENGEWHEFTHHLYHTFVNDRALCNPGYESHGGYHNPDTCDSMDEGFATFLATLAARDIEGASDAVYDNTGFDLAHVKYKPWGWREVGSTTLTLDPTEEDTAVSGLFWDLVDAEIDTENTEVIGANRLHRAVTYADKTTIALKELWRQLTDFNPATVFDLRAMFGTPALTINLDGDTMMDVAAVDQVFLLHGFFPIDTDDTIVGAHKTYHYDVGHAQRQNPSSPRNGAVGLTSHREYDDTGAVKETLIPRVKMPRQPHANVEVYVTTPSGVPLAGATLDVNIQYPDGRAETLTRQLGSSGGTFVHLELPPYFNYLLPTGASLPDCDPAHDFLVFVTLSAMVNGIDSLETPSFDNCTYQHAMAVAEGAAALAFTLTVPVSGTPEVCDGIDNDLDGEIDEGVSSTFYRDADRDGYGDPSATPACALPEGFVTNNDDCDDGNASIHPGALETCNGLDDDCNGQSDEGLSTLRYHRDADGDTYGSASLGVDACVRPSGYVTDGTDCDDGNASIHPGATERCNGVDDDCSGQADEGVQTTFYRDADGDTYGTASVSRPACSLPPGYSGDRSDCNDSDASVHPGAPEICTNRIDDDCDALLDEGCTGAYDFTGFFPPVDNPPTLNTAKAGSAIPIKFSLGGDQGLDIFATGSPVSGAMPCDAAEPLDAIEVTVAAGSSSVSYDATADRYTYVWKTEKAWAGQCRQLNLSLNDGSSHVANFKFMK